MGAGNTMIRNWDGESVRTFYIDFGYGFEETKRYMIEDRRERFCEEYLSGKSFAERRRIVAQEYMDNNYLLREPTDQQVWDYISDIERDDMANLGYIDGFERLRKPEWHDELNSAFRDGAQVIASASHCLLVIADNESSLAVGCVPSCGIDNIHENVADDNDLDRDADDYDTRLEEAQAKAVEEFMVKYAEQANAAMRSIHEQYPELRVRSCAWTSSCIGSPEEVAPDSYY